MLRLKRKETILMLTLEDLSLEVLTESRTSDYVLVIF